MEDNLMENNVIENDIIENNMLEDDTTENSIMEFGLVLKEKPGIDGLTKSDIMDMFDMLDSNEAFPIELEAHYQECSAMGFITPNAAELIDYDYERSGLHDFIAAILDDMANENISCTYTFRGIEIWLSR